MRVVIADDSLLVREGIASLLRRAGVEVVGEADDGDELQRVVDEHEPDVAIVDVRMPPTHTEEGLAAAREIRARHPGMGILILSQHVEVGIAMRALVESPEGLGYLLKERVTDLEDFAGTLRHVAAGGSALDPQVVVAPARRPARRGPAEHAHRPRAPGARARRRGTHEQGDRRAARRQPARRHQARHLDLREARPAARRG